MTRLILRRIPSGLRAAPWFHRRWRRFAFRGSDDLELTHLTRLGRSGCRSSLVAHR